MDASTPWQFLHVVSMFVAVSIFVGHGMLSSAVVRSGDVSSVRRVLAAEDRFAPVGGAVFLLGIVFGFVTALVGDYDLTQTWLVIGYVLAFVILVTGLTFHRRQAERMKAVAAGSDERVASEELRAIASAPSAVAVTVLDGIAWLAIVYVMVVKPFS